MAINFLARFLRRVGSKKQASPADATARAKTAFGIGALVQERYRLDAELGRGGMGIVYRARDCHLDRDIAFKIINLDATGHSTREQFLREAQITAQLHHPNIVAVYETGAVDAGAPEPAPFIAMELVRGKELDALRGLSFAQSMDIARQICNALEYAHAQGLVHRDLKPGNVLVEKRGYRHVAKLVDFGLARPRDAANLPPEHSIAGTIYYVAPELITGAPATVRSDLYALGVLLYEMVTGRVPFSDFDVQAIFEQHLKESVVPPSQTRPDVPLILESLILRLLAKDPQDRYASARQVGRVLEQILAAKKSSATHGNVSRSVPPILGRANEIAQIKHALEDNALVTLTGAGGIGKTQLALNVAHQLTDEFADGVWLIEHAGWSDPALVPAQVASVLGLKEDFRRPLIVALTEHLREKHALLVLDHCGHLVGACKQFVETILRACPDVRILATSRHPLNLADEHVYTVPPLSPTDAEHLLSEHASSVASVNTPSLTRVGEHLNGIPLALELVAAHVKEFPVEQVLANHTTQTHDQILSAVLDWSFAQLSARARELFKRASVFRGGFTIDTIKLFDQVDDSEAINLVTQLVNQSLVDACPVNDGVMRYRMPEPIRQYALAKLQASGGEPDARLDHRDVYFRLALQAAPHLHDAERDAWLARLEPEHANLIAALDWTIERPQHANIAFRFGDALWQYWRARGYWREANDRLSKILALAHTLSDASARVRVLISMGHLAVFQADSARAQSMLDQGLALARDLNDQDSIAYALCGLGALAHARADAERAEVLYRDIAAQYASAGNVWEAANALFKVGKLKAQCGEYLDACAILTDCLDTFRQLGDTKKVAHVLSRLGLIACAREQYSEACTFFQDSLTCWRELSEPFEIASQLTHLGYATLYRGHDDQAHTYFVESVSRFVELNSRQGVADGVYGIAGSFAQRDPERAAQWIGAADALLASGPVENIKPSDEKKNWVIQHLHLESPALQAARAVGRAMSLEQTIADAVESGKG
ncbi:MAG: protein kinase [Chloroflexi bacterium]|nr:protein kinase [Chloroflexota bacterium]